MKVMKILIVVAALRTILKGREQRLEEVVIRRRIETIQTTAFFNKKT